MTVHKHAKIGTAKLNNMELVVFHNAKEPNEWTENVERLIPGFREDWDYFLCLPQHKEVCLHWLNGGEVQAVHFENQMPYSGVMFDSDFVDLEDGITTYQWKVNHIFMQEHEIRIKPKKEKRLIAIHPETSDIFVATSAYIAHDGFQLIEIEVEV